MKQLKIFESALWIRPAERAIAKNPVIFKITFEQAMSFDKSHTSSEQLLEIYGEKNLLKQGEFYDGYVIVCYRYHNEVVRMRGYLQKVPFRNAEWMHDLTMRSNCKEGYLYEVLVNLDGGGISAGLWQYVWTFQECSFAEWAKDLQMHRHLNQDHDPEVLDRTIKDKIINGLIGHTEISLSDDEDLVLRSYAPDYYRKFFVVV